MAAFNRLRCWSLLTRLILFLILIKENSGLPLGTTIAFGYSSPAPFSTARHEETTNSSTTLLKSVPSPQEETFIFDYGSGIGEINGNLMPQITNLPIEIDETEFQDNAKKAQQNKETEEQEQEQELVSEQASAPAPTSPASVEQHDQPIVPPTTLAFSNVAVGNGMMVGTGDGTISSFNESTPPYAAVDDKYVPSKPQNLLVLNVTATSITMAWHPPKNQNGAIVGYHVFHIHDNQTGVAIVKNKKSSEDVTINYVLRDLKPYTEYRINVKAFTTKNEGESSDQIVQRTDIDGPSSPIFVNLSCHSQDAITIRWRRPHEYFNSIDVYKIKTKMMGQERHRDITINASEKELETAMILQNLTTNSVYEVKVAAGTFSIINPKKLVYGKFSETKKISLQPNCEKLQPLLIQSHNDYNLAVLVGIIFSCFGIVLIVMAFFLWSRKCFHAAYYYLDDPPHHPNVPQVDWEVPVEIAGEIRAAVPVNEFAKHVASLHADGDIGFSREYEAIQNECVTDDLACEHSQHPENKRKNRYLNITAYDHSRVHLHPTPGQKKNLDYINANFIDGYQKSRAFIGTQGPLPDTFDCFWRMIWEQRVAIIVMITNLVERGRRKCDMYWPKDGIETYGVIQVKLIEEEVMSTYTVRTLQIKHLKLKKKKQCNSEKTVYQYHYTNWPDHGTPDHPLPVLNFVKKSSAANPQDAGPIVVHCSAGVGRTGTYIVLDAMLKQIQQKGVVNVFGFLRHIRIQRNFLVQTEEQYIFIHDALVEAIASAETNLTAEQIEELKNCTPYLEQQYKNIIQFQTKDIHIASAMKKVNSIKNRGAIFPIEGSRVHLTPKPGEEGSDYINASWLHGFRRLRDFIVTQHPMSHTIKDFWQMVWDHNAQTIVLLSSLDDINFAQFWPDDTTPIESDYYRVRFVSKTNKSDYVSRDFVIQSIQDDYELSVKMLHCPSWPEMSNPNSIYDFIVDVHERCNDYRNGPIVVVDRYGGAQACTFCAISSLAIEMEYCNTANIYQYAKLYHNKRPGVWTSSEDIRLIYNILSYLPSNLQLLKRTALRTEFEDVTTATPDLYSKICSNGNVTKPLTSTNKNSTTICDSSLNTIHPSHYINHINRSSFNQINKNHSSSLFNNLTQQILPQTQTQIQPQTQTQTQTQNQKQNETQLQTKTLQPLQELQKLKLKLDLQLNSDLQTNSNQNSNTNSLNQTLSSSPTVTPTSSQNPPTNAISTNITTVTTVTSTTTASNNLSAISSSSSSSTTNPNQFNHSNQTNFKTNTNLNAAQIMENSSSPIIDGLTQLLTPPPPPLPTSVPPTNLNMPPNLDFQIGLVEQIALSMDTDYLQQQQQMLALIQQQNELQQQYNNAPTITEYLPPAPPSFANSSLTPMTSSMTQSSAISPLITPSIQMNDGDNDIDDETSLITSNSNSLNSSTTFKIPTNGECVASLSTSSSCSSTSQMSTIVTNPPNGLNLNNNNNKNNNTNHYPTNGSATAVNSTTMTPPTTTTSTTTNASLTNQKTAVADAQSLDIVG